MNGDLIVSVLLIAGAMALVGRGVMRRGMGSRQGLTMALIWTGIFAAAFGIARLLTPS